MNDMIPGHDLHMARLTPEFSHWQARLGWSVRRTEQWAPWSLLRDKYGWAILTRATERCEPNDAGFKSVNLVGKLCADMKREAEAAERQAAQDAGNAALKEVKTKARLVNVDGKWVGGAKV